MIVIFIGNEFYRESKTRMSSYYEVKKGGEWNRLAIGEIESAVAAGTTVTIRPPTKAEKLKAKRMLELGA